jgi:hypothetical protein
MQIAKRERTTGLLYRANDLPFPLHPFCVKLTPMGSKDKGRKEVKKAPKPKPKPEPGRKREGFAPAPPK